MRATALALLVLLAPGPAAAATVDVAAPDPAAAAAVRVTGGTPGERAAVRTALAALGGRIRIAAVRIGPIERAKGRALVVRPRAFPDVEAAWQGALVAGEVVRLLGPGHRPALRWRVFHGDVVRLPARVQPGAPAPETAADRAAALGAALEAAGLVDVEVRALPIDGVALRAAASWPEPLLLGPQVEVPLPVEEVSRFVALRRPDRRALQAGGVSRALRSGLSGVVPPRSPVLPVPAAWTGRIAVRVEGAWRVRGRVVRVTRSLACRAGAGTGACRRLRRQRWSLLAPVAATCSLGPLGPAVRVAAQVGDARIDRVYDGCTSPWVDAWRRFLRETG